MSGVVVRDGANAQQFAHANNGRRELPASG